MKCILNNKTQEVKRVSNENADRAVKEGKGWRFISKKVWKEDPQTSWNKNNVPANPINEKKRFRQEKRNH